jgi:hypothetical protein
MAFATFQQRSVVVDIMKSLLFFFKNPNKFAGQTREQHLPDSAFELVVNVNQSAPAVFPWSRNRVTPSLRVRRVQ